MRRNKGFTLIELMLSMTFVAVLIIAITILTIQISNTYTKGITLKQVNETGTDISNDLQRSIRSSVKFEINDPTSYVMNDDQTAGRLCLGEYSYVWNNENAEQKLTDLLVNRYADKPDAKIRLLKVLDRSKSLCKPDSVDGRYILIPGNVSATELLNKGDRDLALHKFIVSSSAPGLYSIALTIGTSDTTLLNDGRDGCRPPVELNGQEDYCSVNVFQITARTNG